MPLLQDASQAITWTIFSRHLQWLSTREAAHRDPYGTGVLIGEAAVSTGYAAVNLTVRPGGHVEPEQAESTLPPMLQGIRSTGAGCNQITTALTPSSSDGELELLRIARDLGISMYRWGPMRYKGSNADRGAEVARLLQREAELARRMANLSEELGLTAVFHAISGGFLGSSAWDAVEMIERVGNERFALNFDVGHMTVEGAAGSWAADLRRALPIVKSITLKDGIVERREGGGAKAVWVESGKGFVDWNRFFAMLLSYGYEGPLETHLEFVYRGVDLNGAYWSDAPDFGLRRDEILEVMGRELAFCQAAAREAGWISKAEPSTPHLN